MSYSAADARERTPSTCPNSPGSESFAAWMRAALAASRVLCVVVACVMVASSACSWFVMAVRTASTVESVEGWENMLFRWGMGS
jgi:hypothetical protein